MLLNKMMSYTRFSRLFISQMQNHRLWNHPFFKLVREEPSLPILREWAIQAGHIDESFVLILRNMLKNKAIKDQESLKENLSDELGNGNPSEEHFTLFRNVLSSINVSEDEYRNTKLTASTEIICNNLIFAASAENPLISLGMMASEELICPREFPPFFKALQQFSPISNLRYFPVHIEADVEHAQDLIRLCYEHSNNDSDIEEILLWQFVDLELNNAFYDSLMSSLKKDFYI